VPHLILYGGVVIPREGVERFSSEPVFMILCLINVIPREGVESNKFGIDAIGEDPRDPERGS